MHVLAERPFIPLRDGVLLICTAVLPTCLLMEVDWLVFTTCCLHSRCLSGSYLVLCGASEGRTVDWSRGCPACCLSAPQSTTPTSCLFKSVPHEMMIAVCRNQQVCLLSSASCCCLKHCSSVKCPIFTQGLVSQSDLCEDVDMTGCDLWVFW